MVAYMDKLVGRVVAKTKEVGIAEDTLILFCGDNGTHKRITSTLNGAEIVGGKGQTTDAGTRVPLIVDWPGAIDKPAVCDDLVDFLPTCLESASLEIPTGLDGRSFLPQLRGEFGQPREWMYCYYCPRPERTTPHRFARDKRWKLYGDGSFFDVSNDVLEKADLAARQLTPQATQAKRKLQAALDSMPAEGQSLLKFVPNDR